MSWKGQRGPAGGTEEQVLESVLKDIRSSLARPSNSDADGNYWVPVESFVLRQAAGLLEHYRDTLAGMQKGCKNMGNDMKREEGRPDGFSLAGMVDFSDLKDKPLTDIGVGGIIKTGHIDLSRLDLDEQEGV